MLQTIDRAKQVTMSELNAIIGVSIKQIIKSYDQGVLSTLMDGQVIYEMTISS